MTHIKAEDLNLYDEIESALEMAVTLVRNGHWNPTRKHELVSQTKTKLLRILKQTVAKNVGMVLAVENADGKWYVWLRKNHPKLKHNTISISEGFMFRQDAHNRARLLADVLGAEIGLPETLEQQ